MFDFVITWVALILIFATTIIRSIFAKQKHSLLYSGILVVACFASFFIMMFSESFLLDFADALKLDELYARFNSLFNSVGMENFYALFMMSIFAMMIYACLVLITLPFVIITNTKERKQDYYQASNSVAANIILGVVRALIYSVIYLSLLVTMMSALQINVSSKLIDIFNDSIFMKVLNDFSKENLASLFTGVL